VTKEIDNVLLTAVENDVVPGVVAMAADRDGEVYEGAAGLRSAADSDPITPDTVMRIASMTKMVTTTAALQLVEQARLPAEPRSGTCSPTPRASGTGSGTATSTATSRSRARRT
jgi:hypothetical protein